MDDKKPKKDHKIPGTVTGKPAGDIFKHPPQGPIVGEVFKPREALQEPTPHQKRGGQYPVDPKAKA